MAQPLDSEGAINIGELLQMLLRRKWFIFFWMFSAACLAVAYVQFIAVPKYTAKASLVMLNRSENIAGLDSVLSDFGGKDIEISTEHEILGNRQLMAAVVEELDLISDPEFNPTLRPEPVISVNQIKNAVKEALAALTGTEETGEGMPDTGMRSILINSLVAAVDIQNVAGTYVFEVYATTEIPAKSTLIANTLVDHYIKAQVARKLSATEVATEWLTGRADGLRVQLEAAENKLANFISSTELISPEALGAQNIQLKEFRARLEKLREDKLRLEQIPLAYQTAPQDDVEAIAAIFQDVGLSRIAPRAATGDTAMRAAFDTRVTELLRRNEIELTRVRSQIDALTQSAADLNDEVTALSRDLLTQQQLEREAEAAGLIYEHFLARLQETAVQQGLQQADSETLAPAEIPLLPSAPRKTLTVAAAMILGFMIGCALVILRETQSRTLRVARDAEDAIGIPVIGQIPKAPQTQRKKLLQYVTSNPSSGLMEAVRNLRTSIQLSFMDRPPKLVMMTSALPDEGKSSTTLLMAHAFAQSGQRVLVIECDVRRRALREFFARRQRSIENGLFAVAAGKAELEEAVVPDETFGFDTLLSENVTVAASDFFLSDSFAKVIETARDKYDMIFLDVPPVLMVTDARVIGKHVDAILFAFKWDATHRDAVLSGVDLLRRFNLNITGLVMNQVDTKKLRAYGEIGGYGDYYGSSHKYYRG